MWCRAVKTQQYLQQHDEALSIVSHLLPVEGGMDELMIFSKVKQHIGGTLFTVDISTRIRVFLFIHKSNVLFCFFLFCFECLKMPCFCFHERINVFMKFADTYLKKK